MWQLKPHLFFSCFVANLVISLIQQKYASLVILLVLLQLGAAGFIFFDRDWKNLIPHDKTGQFEMIYGFLKQNWKIVKWIALGVVVLEALIFLLAILVRASAQPADYDSDDDYIAPRSTARQPLINRQGAPASGLPVTATLDQRPSRNDAWSQRMREKSAVAIVSVVMENTSSVRIATICREKPRPLFLPTSSTDPPITPPYSSNQHPYRPHSQISATLPRRNPTRSTFRAVLPFRSPGFAEPSPTPLLPAVIRRLVLSGLPPWPPPT
ncbi:hypothetical protein KSP40_PGU021603 [Platanthera guangdongensis]|uniref:Uncharacterized protein n=1 Tax=Platanthera guangdongensis TaxID=2320717 RepID=A0ABR2LPG1_9ASPA